MKIVYQPENSLEAQVLAHYLKQFDIESFIEGASTREAFGDVMGVGPISLSVSEADYDKAKPILDQWSADQSSSLKKPMADSQKRPMRLIMIILTLICMAAVSFSMLSLLE